MQRSTYGRRIEAHWAGSASLAKLSNHSTGYPVTAARIVGAANFGYVETVLPEDAFAVSLELLDFERGEIWLDGKNTSQKSLMRGNTVLYDLRHRIDANLIDEFDFVQFHIPRMHLVSMASEHGLSGNGELEIINGQGFSDAAVKSLGELLVPAFERPGEANQLFVDHCILAICAHLLDKFGNISLVPAGNVGLPKSKLRIAKEMIDANLGGNINISQIARAVDLSPSYFAKQFRASTGLSPHKWLLRRRVDRAKSLMSSSSDPLGAIALACGFADQSHLTRVFKGLVGTTPGDWRRSRW